mmetsp:Transcript_32712/g.86435  ORF Transcript_32712/g.86435 Transcript_32712/m.86435 type:complete len:467 (-) Transcript_32712:134-1534(-)
MPLVDVVSSGYNATVFAYGQTGSGKTHTMLGEPDEPGVIGMTLTELFNRNPKFEFYVSFIELYNEEIRDLLNPGSRSGSGPGLDLREDPLRGPQVAGVRQVRTHNAEEVMVLVAKGNEMRKTEGTAANPVSSRSHAVLQVMCEHKNKGKLRVSKLSLIDLAGSERASNTENRGVRLVEGAKINRSLLALGNCINALSKKGMFVNFRDSKLTRLLKDSLGGNTRTVMIAHVSPSATSFEETLNTLKYAHRARSIQTQVKVSWKPIKAKYGEGVMHDVQEDAARIRSQLESTMAAFDAEEEDQPATPPKARRAKKAVKKAKKPEWNDGSNRAGDAEVRNDRDRHRDGREDARRARAELEEEEEGGEEEEDDDEEDLALNGAMEMLSQTRKEVVSNLREQTAIKQSLMEIDDQNVKNKIEISKLQMGVVLNVDNEQDDENADPNSHAAGKEEEGREEMEKGTGEGDEEK